ncbi:unnamed protein product [Penicillium egyptiacum]|uniref:Uncharacterized protein n=1 Tax=Penicillium egyptiacum TaxID=1303716 RepID=A0A9W4PAK6_9EURO|nr:unnamed protein product [Penicillium egyptiacum]
MTWKEAFPSGDFAVNMRELLQVECALRENAQREVALRQKMEKLIEKQITNEQTEHTQGMAPWGSLGAVWGWIVGFTSCSRADDIRALQAKISELNRSSWILERHWRTIRAMFLDELLSRGFELWHSHPKWYMHRTLREKCVIRGGCCARSCGCCSDRHNTPERMLAAGHCTLECLCCEEARGFQLNREQWEASLPPFSRTKDKPSHLYLDRVIAVSFVGIVFGNYDNPFDLIEDSPPSYASSLQHPKNGACWMRKGRNGQ